MSYTPGPWYVFEDDTHVRSRHDGEFIADCGPVLRPLEEREANARLVAVAPEMLRLLETWRKWTEKGKNPEYDQDADPIGEIEEYEKLSEETRQLLKRVKNEKMDHIQQ